MSIALHYSFRAITNESPCDVEQIPEDRVEQVYLKFCDLEKFPEWLMRLENLTHINISCNVIEQVPPALNVLKNLNYLDLSDNRLMSLSPTLFDLTQLRYLDVSGNFIETIPTDIGKLTSLELLNFDRNFVIEIPVELTQCENLFQLSFEECSRLFLLPKNLLMMPNLANVSFRRCNLFTIPSMISPKIMNLQISGNELLNCVPSDVIKFIDPNTTTEQFYMIEEESLSQMVTAQINFIKGSPEIRHLELSNGSLANLPQIEKIFTVTSPEITSLKELSFRAVHDDQMFHLPYELYNLLRSPTALCFCKSRVFSEAFISFFYEKRRTKLQLAISKLFCSKKCANIFQAENKTELVFMT